MCLNVFKRNFGDDDFITFKIYFRHIYALNFETTSCSILALKCDLAGFLARDIFNLNRKLVSKINVKRNCQSLLLLLSCL